MKAYFLVFDNGDNVLATTLTVYAETICSVEDAFPNYRYIMEVKPDNKDMGLNKVCIVNEKENCSSGDLKCTGNLTVLK